MHTESHFLGGEIVRDIVIGMSDGLTVPFALAAGLSGTVSASSVVLAAGIAEIVAGSIAMGLGGFLAAKGEVEHYAHERAREEREVVEVPEKEKDEVREILVSYGMNPEDSSRITDALAQDSKRFVDFMMRFELGLEEPHASRAFWSAFTIGTSYIVGGTIPLLPYALTTTVGEGLLWSCGSTLAALSLLGFMKARLYGLAPLRGILQTVIVGGLAGAAAFLFARYLSPG